MSRDLHPHQHIAILRVHTMFTPPSRLVRYAHRMAHTQQHGTDLRSAERVIAGSGQWRGQSTRAGGARGARPTQGAEDSVRTPGTRQQHGERDCLLTTHGYTEIVRANRSVSNQCASKLAVRIPGQAGAGQRSAHTCATHA